MTVKLKMRQARKSKANFLKFILEFKLTNEIRRL